MVNIKLMEHNEVEIVANFISDINRYKESHIGYCGEDSLEIAHSLRQDITDITYTNSFLTAYDEGELVGVLGFDANLENNSAEIWGPFVKEHKWDVVSSLWNKMIEILPVTIYSISMFPNKQNQNVLQLANDLSFNKHSEQTILSFDRNRIDLLGDVPFFELKEEYNTDMIQLHNHSFPNTYYSGQQIINRLNENRKVFILVHKGNLSGYIYVETEPEYGGASIEFFAVKESERGRGIGRKLLTVALKWLFTIDSIQSITLCVNSNNLEAINLYKKVGFQHKEDLCIFTKKI